MDAIAIGAITKIAVSKVEDCRAVRVCHSSHVHDECYYIGNCDTHKDRDDSEKSLAPNVEDYDCCQSYDSQEPVGGSVSDCRTCKGESDADDDRSSHYRRQEPHNLLHAHQFDDSGKNKVCKTSYNHTAAGVGSFLVGTHSGVDSGVKVGNCVETAQKSEGRTQESWNLHLGAHMENKCSETGTEQSDCNSHTLGDRLTGSILEKTAYKNWHQNGGTKHSNHVLKAHEQHTACTQQACVPDRFALEIFH